MQTFNIHQAKTRLSELVALAERGEDIVIARSNKPAVKLIPIVPQPRKRVAGLGKGTVAWVADDFDDYLPVDFLITPMDWSAPDSK